jgi:hypothetical protein
VAHAAALIEDRRLDEARSIVKRVVAGELRAAPWSHTVPALAQLTMACSELDDRDAAAVLYPRVAPWAHLLAYSNVFIFASISLYAGILARLCGRHDESERKLVCAVEVNDRIRAPFFLAYTHLELARLYAEREQDGDPVRHAREVALALDLGRQNGLGGVERQAWQVGGTATGTAART